MVQNEIYFLSSSKINSIQGQVLGMLHKINTVILLLLGFPPHILILLLDYTQ